MLIERLRKRLAADRASFTEPCLPSPADKPPSGSNWIHEIKHDGYRLMARRDPVGIRLIPGGMTGGRVVQRQPSARGQEQQICEPIHRWFRKGETQQARHAS